MYFKKFNKVYFITPSNFTELELDESNSTSSLDVKWLYDKINENEFAEHKKGNILFVLDDVIGEL